MPSSFDAEIAHYLRSGDCSDKLDAWPGAGYLDRARQQRAALRGALVSAVRQRTPGASVSKAISEMDVVGFTRRKLMPMVRGLFPENEQDVVLDVLGRSVIFLIPATIDGVLEQTPWPSTAWDLANIYLASYGANPFSEDAPAIVGMSEGTTCFVSADYFRNAGRFDDFVVHEAAHIFHNCKRVTIGLPEIRRREWLLDIEFRKRETFAYACEAYSQILEHGANRSERCSLLSELEDGPMPPDERVDAREYLAILRTAVASRNGWKRILETCAPPRKTRQRRATEICG